MLAHAEVCHNALVEFTGKEAFEASNDLALGPAIGGAACDVVWCNKACVDASVDASFFFGWFEACGQVLSCVRPH